MAEPARGDKSSPGIAIPVPSRAQPTRWVGPFVAVLVLMGGGIGAGLYILSLIHAGDGSPAGGAGQANAAEGAYGPGRPSELLTTDVELRPFDLMVNIKGEKGRRYAKVECSLWTGKDDAARLASDQVRRILQMRLEEQLQSYDLEEFEDGGIYERMQRDFKERMQHELQTLFNQDPAGHIYVIRVVCTGLLLQ